MPEPLTTYIANADLYWDWAVASIEFAGLNLTYAGKQANWSTAKTYVGWAGGNFTNIYVNFEETEWGFWYWAKRALQYIDNNWPSTLTMLSLIAAMSIATPDEIMTFICLTDAYHASLWDRPYNPEYFATMVRAFKSWA